ncbi:hypothetical protein NP493_7g04021 [Ridgeia piscesae]|uniref:Cilia- and flagella-associated protein 52 n=1 Tax=Ridgeia piscesae TaxID=27915 RepID=A0AAD9ULC9_RIDPI|nr:hypothetical protein NP493_7g04021 [Ridgeia piscesae]
MTTEEEPVSVPLLQLESMIGYNGKVAMGLIVHPDRQHLIYPIGCTVIVENMETKKQDFLAGHTDTVSCITISKCGRFIASGQATYMGFKADIFLWDFERREKYAKFTLHKVKVERLVFSPTAKYLVSLGGGDDGSVVVWDVGRKEPLRGLQAQKKSAGMTFVIAFANQTDDLFVTAGDDTLRIWHLELDQNKMTPVDVAMGSLKRNFKCIQISEDDSFFYAGTTTGDIVYVNIPAYRFQAHGPVKGRFSMGVTALKILKTGEILVGAGDGTVAIVNGREGKFKRTNKEQKVKGTVLSLTLRGEGHQFFVGTSACNIYRFNFAEFTHMLLKTCHDSPINDIAFPYGCDDLYVTCSYQDIRVWHLARSEELLRITVNNMTCMAIAVMNDGRTILSGWDDGYIRAYSPQTGTPLYTIQDAHSSRGVTALATFFDCVRFVSGGMSGQVRIWRIDDLGRKSPKLEMTLKEHTASITAIKMRRDDKSCVTSSDDGSCIIWNLEKGHREQMVHANTLFQYVCYHPAEYQFITTGTDRKIAYWETFDGSLIREVEGSKSGSINGMDIASDGNYFVSGGDDKLVKLWNYDAGVVEQIGIGHSAHIKRVLISPNENFILSVSTDGAILRWRYPNRR